MAARNEGSGYGVERNSAQGSVEEPFFMEPGDQISLWRERSIINPTILKEVPEVVIDGPVNTEDGQAIL